MGCERSNTSSPQSSNTSNTNNPTVTNRDEAARTAGANLPGDQIGAVDLTLLYKSLGNTANDAVSKGKFDDVVDHFDKPDRDRIGNFKDQKFAELDGLIDKLSNDWKSKYNESLDINDVKVYENWLRVTKVDETKDYTKANALFPASHGVSELTVPVIKHQVTWKIDAPDELTGMQLVKNLQDHLTHFDNMKDQWPADKLEARRALAHHIFAALMNKPVMSGAR
jgi:hypothetical protein